MPTAPKLTYVRPLYGPDHPKGPTIGPDVLAWKRMLWRWDAHVFPGPALAFDDVYNRRTVNATRVAQRYWKLTASGSVGKQTFDRSLKALRDRGEHKPLESAWDQTAINLYRKAKPRIPLARCFVLPKGAEARDLGGVAAHMARPLGNWQSDNAIDIGSRPGVLILAPEAGWVVRVGGHDPKEGPQGTIFGESLTIETDGGGGWFLTHIDRIVGIGERVVAGEIIGRIADWPGSVSLDHVHVGCREHSPERLWSWPRVEVGHF